MNDLVIWLSNSLVLFSIIFLMFGCVVGSFLNVVIYRLPLGMSVASPPSHCPNCEYHIPWYLNIPLFAWLWQRGKCAECRKPISIRYFLVELLTGLAFLGAWLQVNLRFVNIPEPFITHPFYAALVTLALVTLLGGLIASTFIDFDHFIIPDELTKGGMVAGVLFSIAAPQLHGAYLGEEIGRFHALLLSLMGMACGGAVVYAVVRLGKALFGKQTFTSEEPVRVTFATHAMHMESETGEDATVLPYEDIFYREEDTVMLFAERAELVDRCYWDQPVSLTGETLKIGREKFVADEVPHLEVFTREVVVPREAMGFGDVKFMAAIGAFLGWQATLFSLMASAMVGAVVGVLLMATRKDNANIIPYGPYIALAAVGWIFGGYELWGWWWGRLSPAG
jgi:leader peptidase (prepilin peptidase)/N-methyltransferase